MSGMILLLVRNINFLTGIVKQGAKPIIIIADYMANHVLTEETVEALVSGLLRQFQKRTDSINAALDKRNDELRQELEKKYGIKVEGFDPLAGKLIESTHGKEG